MENRVRDESHRRLFVALELTEEWRQEISGVRQQLEPVAGTDLRWVRLELMHVTIVFLGSQAEAIGLAIEESLRLAASEVAPFALAMGKPGHFGPAHSLRVIWMGLATVPPELLQLYNTVSAALSGKGIAFDRKPMAPHVTLARSRPTLSRDASLKLSARLQAIRPGSPPALEVSQFVLMESHLSPRGPSYEVIRAFRLGTTR